MWTTLPPPDQPQPHLADELAPILALETNWFTATEGWTLVPPANPYRTYQEHARVFGAMMLGAYMLTSSWDAPFWEKL